MCTHFNNIFGIKIFFSFLVETITFIPCFMLSRLLCADIIKSFETKTYDWCLKLKNERRISPFKWFITKERWFHPSCGVSYHPFQLYNKLNQKWDQLDGVTIFCTIKQVASNKSSLILKIQSKTHKHYK